MESLESQACGPWWHYRLMWLVVGGPALVVLASFVTLFLALRTPDPVYADAPQQVQQRAEPGMQPAIQGRNHAGTGGRLDRRKEP